MFRGKGKHLLILGDKC